MKYIILIALGGFVLYQVVKLIQDIKNKNKNKEERKNKENENDTEQKS